MGKFLMFAVAGFAAAAAVDYLRGGKGFLGSLGQPQLTRHRGFIPLETPRATLPGAGANYAQKARLAYLTRDQRPGLGQIDYFLM